MDDGSSRVVPRRGERKIKVTDDFVQENIVLSRSTGFLMEADSRGVISHIAVSWAILRSKLFQPILRMARDSARPVAPAPPRSDLG